MTFAELLMHQTPGVLSFLLSVLGVVALRAPGDPRWFVDFIFGALSFYVWGLAQVFRRMYFRAEAPVAIRQERPTIQEMSIAGACLLILSLVFVGLLVTATKEPDFLEGYSPAAYIVASFAPIVVFSRFPGKHL